MGIQVTEPKVNNLDAVVVIKKQILWLEISVDNAQLMYVLNAR